MRYLQLMISILHVPPLQAETALLRLAEPVLLATTQHIEHKLITELVTHHRYDTSSTSYYVIRNYTVSVLVKQVNKAW